MSNLKVEQGTQITPTVPLFLKKLWKMVNDEGAQDTIGWNSTGDGFIIHDPVNFITKLLPHYFKHNNLASFVRQLNFYDFHKVASVDKDGMQFAHSYFLKDLPETLVFITRKASSAKAKSSKDVPLNEGEVHSLLNDVKDLKGKHALVNKELQQLKNENSALWNEINSLRAKYSKQSQIINKLLHFLISYIHSHRNVFTKQSSGVNTKKIPKNLKSGPSLLEIDYKGTQKTPASESLSFILNQASSSSAITYNTKPTTEDESTYNMDLLDSILKDTDDSDLPYSVQFPKSPSEKSPTGLEVIRKEIPATTTADVSQSRKLVQIDKSGTLEDIFLVKDVANDKAITYSIKYPKVNCPMETKTVVTPQETDPKPKIKILENQTIIPPRGQLNTDPQNVLELNVSSSAVDVDSKEENIKLITNPMKELPIKNVQKKSISRKRQIKDKTQTSSVKKQNIYNKEEVGETQSSNLLEAGIPINEFVADPNILNIIDTVPAQSKKLNLGIRNNPKESLSLYVDNTESEINNFQDILSNINVKDWDKLLQDLSPIDEIDNQKEMNEQENHNLNVMNKSLSDVMEEYPIEENDNIETDKSAGILSDENIFDGENPENFVNIDEYFNNDFEIE